MRWWKKVLLGIVGTLFALIVAVVIVVPTGWGRGHMAFDSGSEVMHFDDVAIAAAVKMPVDAPLDAHAIVNATWRERATPLAVDAQVHNDKEGTDVAWLSASAGAIRVLGSAIHITKQSVAGNLAIIAPAAEVERLVPTVRLPDDVQVV